MFQRAIDTTLSIFKYQLDLAYLGQIVIFSRTQYELAEHTWINLERL